MDEITFNSFNPIFKNLSFLSTKRDTGTHIFFFPFISFTAKYTRIVILSERSKKENSILLFQTTFKSYFKAEVVFSKSVFNTGKYVNLSLSSVVNILGSFSLRSFKVICSPSISLFMSFEYLYVFIFLNLCKPNKWLKWFSSKETMISVLSSKV